jgi:hypothetical protein
MLDILVFFVVIILLPGDSLPRTFPKVENSAEEDF